MEILFNGKLSIDVGLPPSHIPIPHPLAVAS